MNKFFVACLCVGLCMALFSGVFALMGWGGLLRQVGSTLLYPFEWAIAGISDGVTGFAHYFADIDKLTEEANALRQENESLKAAIRDAEILKEEYSWLYQYLSMKEEHQSYTFCGANVTSRVTSGAYAVELTLNKGSAHGVAEGMPVITPQGVIGVVCEVGLTHSRVRTLMNTAASADAVVVRSGESGLCEGDFTALANGQLMLKFLPAEADIEIGDSVLTGGDGRVYPYGLPIGRVTGITFNAFSRTTEATLQPFADFSDLDQVMILTSYDRYAEGHAPEVSP